MHEPRVSVVIPVLNRRDYLRSTVLSLLAEPLSLEVVVVDDGSTDGSLSTIEDLPVRCVRLERNHGLSYARNRGLALCRAPYVLFFDSDDLLAPGGIVARWRWLEDHPEAVCVGGTLGGTLDGLGRWLEDPCPLPPREPLSLDFFRRGERYCCGPWLYLHRRESLLRLGGFDESLKIASDSDLLFRILAHHPIPVLPVATLFYRRHDGNTSFEWTGDRPLPRPRNLAESWLVLRSHHIEAGAPL